MSLQVGEIRAAVWVPLSSIINHHKTDFPHLSFSISPVLGSWLTLPAPCQVPLWPAAPVPQQKVSNAASQLLPTQSNESCQNTLCSPNGAMKSWSRSWRTHGNTWRARR